jgi:hypothetical protein
MNTSAEAADKKGEKDDQAEVDEAWVREQARFWYGCDAGRRDWARVLEALSSMSYGRRVRSPLRRTDVTTEAVRARYGEFGAYRHHLDAETMEDWVRHDELGSLTYDHAFPITMADAVGPRTPLIAYNRMIVVGESDLSATLWPLRYHLEVARRGLVDAEPFAAKVAKVAFRGVLSGAIEYDARRGKTSRAAVVARWRGERWADLGLSGVPPATRAAMTEEQRAWVDALGVSRMRQEDLMRHRYVLCIEGADISSGFGWALASNCVPVHPYPFVSEVWYFCGLRPWVHFVPVRQDASDLDAAYAWCEAHPGACEEIAANGRRHMRRMLDGRALRRVKAAVVGAWGLRRPSVGP